MTIRIKSITVFCLLLMLGSCEKINDIVPAETCNRGDVTHTHSSRYQKLTNLLLSNGLVGGSFTIITPEGTWSSGIGKSDLKNNTKMTPCHTLRIGSVSKIFAAVAILKLQEQGKLNIDDKASKYLPQEFVKNIANAEKATIKQLLTHTSGIVEYSSFGNVLNILNLSIVKDSAEDNLRSIFGKKAAFEAGARDNYSNSNYLLLSLIIKNISGKSAYQYLNTEIFEPQGFNKIIASSTIPSSLARAYYDIYDNGKVVDRTEIENNAVGGEEMIDGGLIANSYDLAKFHEKLMTGKILSNASVKSMSEFRPITQDLGDLDFIKGYGLGMMSVETNFGMAIGHYGTVQSFNGMVFHFPDKKVTIAFIRNNDSSKLKKFIESKAFFDYFFQD